MLDPVPRAERACSPTVDLVPRPVAESVDEMLDGATRVGAFEPDERRSDSNFERVEIDGEPFIVKHIHPDHDFTMRVTGDIGCRPLRVWEAGLMDVAPDLVDHATVAAARDDGRNGWGAALLLRDVSGQLTSLGDVPLDEGEHLNFIDSCARMSARMWGWHDDLGLLPHHYRWVWFAEPLFVGERDLGWPERAPRIANDGWQRFDERAPRDVGEIVRALWRDAEPLSAAVRTTPQTFLHGDWKMSNLGTASDGRVILLDWAYPGEGPACHELAWYLALNRAKLPIGHTKESTIDMFRAALDRCGVSTDGWWEKQLGLCLLGMVVIFGWEKALGDDDELGWWCDAAREGARWL
jgi:hypothetical protein